MTTTRRIEHIYGENPIKVNDEVLFRGDTIEKYVHEGSKDIHISEIDFYDHFSNEKIRKIAELCHTMNKIFCETIGDESHAEWQDTSIVIRESAISGVKYKLKNPQATSRQMHSNWSNDKVSAGYRYGDKKCDIAKTHPNLVEYSKLSNNEKYKDKLFMDVVGAFLK